jgi:hypothetical protein
MELDHGVRLLFAEHGVTVKRPRFNEYPARSRERPGEGPENGGPSDPQGRGVPENPGRAPVKRRRRRRPAGSKPVLEDR